MDQELELQRNWAVQELVDALQTARPNGLQLGRDAAATEKNGERASKKRKVGSPDEQSEHCLGREADRIEEQGSQRLVGDGGTNDYARGSD